MGEKKRRVFAKPIEDRSIHARAVNDFLDHSHDAPIVPQPCLGCGKILDTSSPAGNQERPHEGALSICWDCGHVQVFDENLRFRPPTDDEIVEIAGHPAMVAALNIRRLKDFYERDDEDGAAAFVESLIRKDLKR
jgi:hypothetical protein